MPKVSIIVPVYNVQKYLKRCLDSLINQTLFDIEIIAINDGSTDKSLSILEDYKKRDSRLQIINQPNMGLGLTRNVGLNYVSGDYIAFVDSDDFIELDALENMYKIAIVENSDVVCGQLIMFYDSENKKIRKDFSDIKDISLKKIEMSTFLKDYYLPLNFSYNACDKLYRREMVIKNNVLFGDNKKIFSEDNYFQLQILEFADIISFYKKPYYYYYQRANSIMNTYKSNLIERHFHMMDWYRRSVKKQYQEHLWALLSFEIIIMEVLNILQSGLKFNDFVLSMKKIRKNECFKQSVKTIVKNKLFLLENNKYKRAFMLIVCSFEIYAPSSLVTRLVYFVYKIKLQL